ncbi:SDR family oxidoreductase [Flavivirga algicola]|uniref:SDR family oxidoreductase n=1 Tax=Flavivirga algicola TaxID=2729136 RepID=A0ABX1S0D5_9FLAO|nr:SDR family oxidoreductase [Flavivirga algicola]NMH88700.1 SDR family oxidoreductase [Flavivirga algicola]
MENLRNKTALITGATSGIGLASAKALAKMGAELYLVGRNAQKGKKIVQEIKSETENQNVYLIIGNLSSLMDVKKIAQTFLNYNKPLHILLNNAGVYNTTRKLTIDGYEEMFAVNHLSHFLLTNLLLERIKSGSPARIVNVASGAHMLVKEINFDDLSFENGFKSLKVYSHSKLANILFTYELARILKNSNITVNSVDPGEVGTNLGSQNGLFGKIISPIMKLFLQTPEKGAKTSIYMCSSQEVERISGKNFRHCKEKQPKPWATNNEVAKKLWDISESLVQEIIEHPTTM